PRRKRRPDRPAGRRPRAGSRSVPRHPRGCGDLADGEGVRHPRVPHGARRAARDTNDAARPVLGCELRGPVQSRGRARRSRAEEARGHGRSAAAAHDPRGRVRARRAAAVRWFRSLRSRLTALFVGIAALAVTGAAVGMSELVDAAVWGTVDAELGEEAETVCSLLESGAVNDLRRAVAAIASEPRPGPGKFIHVAGSDGRVLAHAGDVPQAIANAPTAWAPPATVHA